MSDTPLVDECRRTNALGIFELAEQLERRARNIRNLCQVMTEEVDGLTDEDIASIAERHAGDPDCLQVYVKFIIGLYHKEKSNAATWRLKFEMEVSKHA
jgi:hypothetical protein